MFIKSFIVSATLCGILRCAAQTGISTRNGTNRNFIYNVYNYDTLINLTLNASTEQILDFDEESEAWRGYPSRVHVSTTSDVDSEHPVFVTATQQKGVSSWELPLVVQTGGRQARSNNMARTLCPHDAGPNITTVNRPTLQLTTSAPAAVAVRVRLRRVRDFFVQLDKEVYLNVTPSTPKYYYFSFDNDPPAQGPHRVQLPRFNYTIPKSVILIVESDDDICAVVSIQNNSCPVFDNEQDVKYQGYHLTMMNNGGITLTQSMLPVGFYVVFIVKQDDADCTGVSETPIRDTDAWEGERIKNFRFRVIATISYKEYVVAALVALAVLLLLLALTALISCFTLRCHEQVVIIEEEPAPSTSGAAVSDATPLCAEGKLRRTESLSSCDSQPQELVLARPLTVAGLSRRCAQHERRSDRYFWSALTVAVVYALPVVQLLFTYQRMVFQTGDQDLCYYNFLCAHPLWSLSDFNHVYSNVGYVLLGLAFIAQVRARQRRQAGRTEALGIPPHHGIFYSMGLALSMEGVLSACYHLCPNKMNFQFDSSFMYVIAVLCMIKLYQNRHPDVNANAHSTFMLLAVVMTIGLFGIMYPSVYFWVVFTILHLTTCFVLTMKIYYVGQFKMEAAMFRRGLAAFRARSSVRALLRPADGARAALLAVANAANWALAAYGLYEHNKDLARHLLAILMGNAVLYLLAYVVGKLAHKERVPLRAWLFGALAHVCWGGALYLFLDGHTRWADTPAQSRRRNAECSSLQFYDSHDLWHGASAAAMFLSFNMLLVIDDPLADTPRELIPVF